MRNNWADSHLEGAERVRQVDREEGGWRGPRGGKQRWEQADGAAADRRVRGLVGLQSR